MAAYALKGSYPTVQVLSPTLTEEIQYCTIQTSPSDVVASIAVSQLAFSENQANVELQNFADAIEQIMALNYVIGASGTQKIDSSGLLADFVTFTIGYPDTAAQGSSITGSADVPVGLLNFSDAEIGQFALQQVEAITQGVYNNLASAAGG